MQSKDRSQPHSNWKWGNFHERWSHAWLWPSHDEKKWSLIIPPIHLSVSCCQVPHTHQVPQWSKLGWLGWATCEGGSGTKLGQWIRESGLVPLDNVYALVRVKVKINKLSFFSADFNCAPPRVIWLQCCKRQTTSRSRNWWWIDLKNLSYFKYVTRADWSTHAFPH